MEIQWHLFPLQLIAMLVTFMGARNTGIILMFATLILGGICFKSHMTDALMINL